MWTIAMLDHSGVTAEDLRSTATSGPLQIDAFHVCTWANWIGPLLQRQIHQRITVSRCFIRPHHVFLPLSLSLSLQFIFIYIYIYICVCVCACVRVSMPIYMFIYIYIYIFLNNILLHYCILSYIIVFISIYLSIYIYIYIDIKAFKPA